MWKKKWSSAVMKGTATLHEGTCTKRRVVTYDLDSSGWIHETIYVEERIE